MCGAWLYVDRKAEEKKDNMNSVVKMYQRRGMSMSIMDSCTCWASSSYNTRRVTQLAASDSLSLASAMCMWAGQLMCILNNISAIQYLCCSLLSEDLHW